MIRPVSLGLLVAAILGYGLFMLKYEVQSLKGRLSDLNVAIAAERESLHVLKAEWSYLNRPAYLEELAANYLGLERLGDSRRVTPASLPLRPAAPSNELIMVDADSSVVVGGGGADSLAGAAIAVGPRSVGALRPVPVPIGFRRAN